MVILCRGYVCVWVLFPENNNEHCDQSNEHCDHNNDIEMTVLVSVNDDTSVHKMSRRNDVFFPIRY